MEFDFRVKEEYAYDVDLKIFFHNKDDRDERKVLISQLGDGIFSDGSIGHVGIPIKLRVRLKSLNVQGPEVRFDRTNDKIPFRNAASEFASKRVIMGLNDQKLQPGTYRIRVDNLHPVPEFADRSIRVFVRPAEQGK